VDIEEGRELMATIGNVKVQFMPVGRSRREWMWKARDESNTITISGHRFDSLGEAVRDARTQIDGTPDLMSDDDDGPFVA
jgi:hypothetical protein